jgi:hypothetical protein
VQTGGTCVCPSLGRNLLMEYNLCVCVCVGGCVCVCVGGCGSVRVAYEQLPVAFKSASVMQRFNHRVCCHEKPLFGEWWWVTSGWLAKIKIGKGNGKTRGDFEHEENTKRKRPECPKSPRCFLPSKGRDPCPMQSNHAHRKELGKCNKRAKPSVPLV